MPEIPTLAQVLAGHSWYPQTHSCLCEHPRYMVWTDHSDHQAAAWRSACTIETVDQLKACPRGSVVMDANEKPFRRWPAEGDQDYWTSGEIALPALLVWHPGWSV